MTDIRERFTDSPVIAVLRNPPAEAFHDIVRALEAGGVTNLEVTIQSDESLDLLRQAIAHYSETCWIGAGTVTSPELAKQAIDAGAQFLFAPNSLKEVIQTGKDAGVVTIPGVMTPTEMVTAMNDGADAVKVFPASVFGPQYLNELKGPLPSIPMIPTGGVNETNIGAYMKAGAIAAGMGGSLLNQDLIKKGDFSGLTELAKRCVKEAKEGRRHG